MLFRSANVVVKKAVTSDEEDKTQPTNSNNTSPDNTDVTQPDNTKGTDGTSADNNSSSVNLADNGKIQTGSLSVAVVAIVLIASAAVIYFLRKRKEQI